MFKSQLQGKAGRSEGKETAKKKEEKKKHFKDILKHIFHVNLSFPPNYNTF